MNRSLLTVSIALLIFALGMMLGVTITEHRTGQQKVLCEKRHFYL